MIRLRRDDNMSVCLVCDHNGLARLTDAMRGDNKITESSLEVAFDKSIFTLKRKSPTVFTNLTIKLGDFTRFSLDGDDVVWTITDEDRDCIISRFKQCDTDGAFVPAELIRIQVSKNRNLDYLYAELVQKTGEP